MVHRSAEWTWWQQLKQSSLSKKILGQKWHLIKPVSSSLCKNSWVRSLIGGGCFISPLHGFAINKSFFQVLLNHQVFQVTEVETLFNLTGNKMHWEEETIWKGWRFCFSFYLNWWLRHFWNFPLELTFVDICFICTILFQLSCPKVLQALKTSFILQ